MSDFGYPIKINFGDSFGPNNYLAERILKKKSALSNLSNFGLQFWLHLVSLWIE